MARYSLAWDDYTNSLCGGFSSLQQNGEFVDMTLAADGHFVKVHQVIMALVSPYLKELITSAPCPHPVIYLNNVSSETLTSLLEFVYTGQTQICADNLKSFIETAKNLHIKGLEDLNKEDGEKKVFETSQKEDDSEICYMSGRKRIVTRQVAIKAQEVGLPHLSQNIVVKNEKKSTDPVAPRKRIKTIQEESQSFMDDSGARAYDDGFDTINDSCTTLIEVPQKPASNLQYSLSNRGSIQVVLNRYIYNLQCSRHKTGVQRWRCVEYRDNSCKAFVVTKGNVVLSRGNPHNHPFHDKKILEKINKGAVFSEIQDLESYQKEREGEHAGSGKLLSAS